MREIKFRIFDGEDMRIVKKQGYMGFTGVIDQIEGNEKYEWMQFTGIKDSNGVEIYEGDILTPLQPNYENANVEVVYKAEAASFIGRYINYGIGDYEMLNEHDFKVIGNIHLNKELTNV